MEKLRNSHDNIRGGEFQLLDSLRPRNGNFHRKVFRVCFGLHLWDRWMATSAAYSGFTTDTWSHFGYFNNGYVKIVTKRNYLTFFGKKWVFLGFVANRWLKYVWKYSSSPSSWIWLIPRTWVEFLEGMIHLYDLYYHGVYGVSQQVVDSDNQNKKGAKGEKVKECFLWCKAPFNLTTF